MSRSRRTLTERLADERGLKLIGPDELTIRRQRCGKGFMFVQPAGTPLRDKDEVARLKSLAVPPAYTEVAESLANTPTICRKSYVHEAVVSAFEKGALAKVARSRRSAVAKALARLVARHS
jgi:DNA topoisomerase IB